MVPIRGRERQATTTGGGFSLGLIITCCLGNEPTPDPRERWKSSLAVRLRIQLHVKRSKAVSHAQRYLAVRLRIQLHVKRSKAVSHAQRYLVPEESHMGNSFTYKNKNQIKIVL